MPMAPAANTSCVHFGITCDGCNMTPIEGLRFKCSVCPNFDLCAGCFMRKEELHDAQHSFTNVLEPVKGSGLKGKGKGKGKGWKGSLEDKPGFEWWKGKG